MSLNSIIGIPIATIAKITNKQATEIARMSSPSTTVAVNYFNDFSSSTVGQVPINVDNPYNNPIVVDDNGNKVCRIVGAQSFGVDLNPASSYVKFTAKIKYVSGDVLWAFGLRSTPENILTTGSWGDSRLSIYKNFENRMAVSTTYSYDNLWHTFQATIKNGELTLKKDGVTFVTYTDAAFPFIKTVSIASWGTTATHYIDDFRVETEESQEVYDTQSNGDVEQVLNDHSFLYQAAFMTVFTATIDAAVICTGHIFSYVQ